MIKRAIVNDKNTTMAGIAIILVAIGTAGKALFDGDPNTVPNWNIIITEIIAAIGLIVAGDGGK